MSRSVSMLDSISISLHVQPPADILQPTEPSRLLQRRGLAHLQPRVAVVLPTTATGHADTEMMPATPSAPTVSATADTAACGIDDPTTSSAACCCHCDDDDDKENKAPNDDDYDPKDDEWERSRGLDDD